MRVFSLIIFLIVFVLVNKSTSYASLDNKISENQKQYGKELESRQFSETDRHFSGEKIYLFSLYGWQVQVLYKDGRSFSESARPKGNNVKKEMISEKEATVIADILYPRKKRGSYKKQITNAHFISHFFEHGVVSFEMKLDKRGKKHVGVIGVRTVLYSNGDIFKDIKVNAYH